MNRCDIETDDEIDFEDSSSDLYSQTKRQTKTLGSRVKTKEATDNKGTASNQRTRENRTKALSRSRTKNDKVGIIVTNERIRFFLPNRSTSFKCKD